METTRHQGRTAVVTGVGNGIGRATLLRLAQEGATVTGCDVSAEALEDSARALADAGLTAKLVRADVTSQADVDSLIAEAGPRVDILASVAGIMDFFLPLADTDDATWDRVMAVNLTGVMRLTRAVIPLMQANGGGAIVTVASKASTGAGASGAAYTASKHGVIGLVRSVAYFYGPDNIRSNAVLPGSIGETAIGTTAAPRVPWAMERAATTIAVSPPPGHPDQVAAVISWLGTDEASYVNGALVSVDGGWAAA